MKEFWIACTAIVAVMVISYRYMELPPQPLPQQEAAQGADQKTDARVPQQQTADIPEKEQPAVSEQQPAVSEQQPAVSEQQPAAPQQQPAASGQQPAVSEQQEVAAMNVAIEDTYPDSMPLRPDLSYLSYYVYSEVPPDTKPAEIVMQALKEIPEGAPVDEIDLAASVMGVDTGFMKAVARIESGFDPKQRTGSYIGLFQLSHYEFDKYGAGSDIADSRANAVAAMYKFITAAVMFEMETHKKPTISDLYLIHQQGTQGAAEHVSHPERIAWKSMCATDEGRIKGEKWCKRAIWQNTLPAIKQVWKSVDNLTSGAFVEMWQQRVVSFYAHYSQAFAQK
jgi:hypothetical protein